MTPASRENLKTCYAFLNIGENKKNWPTIKNRLIYQTYNWERAKRGAILDSEALKIDSWKKNRYNDQMLHK